MDLFVSKESGTSSVRESCAESGVMRPWWGLYTIWIGDGALNRAESYERHIEMSLVYSILLLGIGMIVTSLSHL